MHLGLQVARQNQMVAASKGRDCMGHQRARFVKLLKDAPSPQLGDSSALGTMYTRAFRYCEPMRTASEIGWYIFPPFDMDLVFDGASTFWRTEEAEPWYKLSHLKDRRFRDEFEELCPADLDGAAPISIGSSIEPGVLQVWSGYILQTPASFSALVRNPPNLPSGENFSNYEGVIRTDKWFGPLFTNIRILRTDVVVSLRKGAPLFFVQMIRNEDCSRELYAKFDIEIGTESLTDSDWTKFSEVMSKDKQVSFERGSYARKYRRDRKRLQQE